MLFKSSYHVLFDIITIVILIKNHKYFLENKFYITIINNLAGLNYEINYIEKRDSDFMFRKFGLLNTNNIILVKKGYQL